MPVVLAAIDKLVRCVRRHVGYFDRVVEVVISFAIGALNLGDLVGWDPAQICFHFHELGYAFYR